MFLGPIYRLHLVGTCCPCLESAESNELRLADLALQSIPIRWLRMIRPHALPKSKGNASLFDNICCDGPEDFNGVDNDLVEKIIPTYVAVDATISLVDTPHNRGPALRIISNAFVLADDDAPDSGKRTNGNLVTANGVVGSISENIKMIKTIPLSEIECAVGASEEEWRDLGVLENGGNGGDDSSRNTNTGILIKSKDGYDGTKRLLLVLEVAYGGDQTRDQVVKNINTLVNGWNRTAIEDGSSKAGGTDAGDDDVKHVQSKAGAGDVLLLENRDDNNANNEGSKEEEKELQAETEETTSKHDNDADGSGKFKEDREDKEAFDEEDEMEVEARDNGEDSERFIEEEKEKEKSESESESEEMLSLIEEGDEEAEEEEDESDKEEEEEDSILPKVLIVDSVEKEKALAAAAAVPVQKEKSLTVDKDAAASSSQPASANTNKPEEYTAKTNSKQQKKEKINEDGQLIAKALEASVSATKLNEKEKDTHAAEARGVEQVKATAAERAHIQEEKRLEAESAAAAEAEKKHIAQEKEEARRQEAAEKEKARIAKPVKKTKAFISKSVKKEKKAIITEPAEMDKSLVANSDEKLEEIEKREYSIRIGKMKFGLKAE